MQGGEDLSIDELASNLSTYRDQLHQVILSPRVSVLSEFFLSRAFLVIVLR